MTAMSEKEDSPSPASDSVRVMEEGTRTLTPPRGPPAAPPLGPPGAPNGPVLPKWQLTCLFIS